MLTALLGVFGYAVAEDITLTTYYPSPRGVYQELRTAGNTQIGSLAVPGDTGGPSLPAPRLSIVQDQTADPSDPPETLVAPAFEIYRRDPATGALTPIFLIDESGTTITNGFIIEPRTSDPANPKPGRVWLRTDIQ